MKDKKNTSLFWKKALHKYRFVIMTDDSFEEKLSVKLSRLNVFALVGFLVFFCFLSSVILITNTNLNEYIPGRATSDVQDEIISLSIKSDSLLNNIESQAVYLENIRNIINGDKLFYPASEESDGYITNASFVEKTIADSLLRDIVESEDRGTINNSYINNNEVILFFPPLLGMITDKFDAKTNHYGIDLVAKENTRISSILDGVVVISHWTPETGYVVGIQHKNGYLSFYKHNSVVLKSVGDFVKTGDHVSIIGNSGEFSSGPHLHFELWHKGLPLNPEEYINF